MTPFHLQIVTADGLLFDGQVQSVSCRTIHGDLAILANHCNYCTAVAMGKAKVVLEDGTVRTAACIGGMLSMMDGNCRLIPTTWEWSEDISLKRARRAQRVAEETLQRKDISQKDIALAEARLHRALVRISAAGDQKE